MAARPDTLHDLVEKAGHILVFTGAGVSAESGIATFRDALTGLWANNDPQQLATPEGFIADPARVWGWYQWRRQQLLSREPNAAHRAIAALAQRVPKVTVVTQNVDDLHERAGSDAVIHLHGSLLTTRCFDCEKPAQVPVDEVPLDGAAITPPSCGHCGGMLRPGVVWFGEALPEDAWQRAVAAAQSADLVLVVGTSGLVYPAAQIPQLAWEGGATVVHVNTEPVPVAAEREHSLVGPAGEVLAELLG
ncbi:NAD-dependent deacetylase [Pseudomonas saudimassiliensis]|uniref:NAD-dependent protein deacylase n=1 Tax=Pseudomonas saudimassiliensis TaxID=1461581 RepID=A0A078MFX1_9PSED|nr:NAD-dependent deacylase [Pseudomonas saudimassiliensis]CEA04322.1 NAD-dependent deacetylase [Pseudomonas saudimassiliensis]CEF26530.1 NAD-dependent deacetylase [Pseudomonas saudimassiliensis]